MNNTKKGLKFVLMGEEYVFSLPQSKSDGSPFYTIDEVMKLREELGTENMKDFIYPNSIEDDANIERRYKMNDDEKWRLPTMTEMKAIISMINWSLCNPSSFSGRYFASSFEVDTHMGYELVTGVVRHKTKEKGFFFWTDPIYSPGEYVKITDSKVEFGKVSKIDDVPNHDEENPSSQPAYCVLLVQTREKGYETEQEILNPEFKSKYGY